MNTHDKCRLPIKSAVWGKKYVDDEGSLTGVAAVAVETAVDAMATIAAVAEVQVEVAVSAWWRQRSWLWRQERRKWQSSWSPTGLLWFPNFYNFNFNGWLCRNGGGDGGGSGGARGGDAAHGKARGGAAAPGGASTVSVICNTPLHQAGILSD